MNNENVTQRTVKKWAFIAPGVSIPVAIVVSHFIDPGRGKASGLTLGLMIGTVRAFWYPIALDAGRHTIHVPYFEGTPTGVALALWVRNFKRRSSLL